MTSKVILKIVNAVTLLFAANAFVASISQAELSCSEIFARTSSAVPLTANIDVLFSSMLGRMKLKISKDGVGEAFGQYYYRDARLLIQKASRHPGATVALGSIKVPAAAVTAVATSGLETSSPRSRTWNQVINETPRTFEISPTSAELLAFTPTPLKPLPKTSPTQKKSHDEPNLYRLAVLRAGVELVHLPTLSTDTSIFVLEFEPYKGADRYGRVTLNQFDVPSELPQRQPVFHKTFDLSDLNSTEAPRVLAFGRYLIIGGRELAIFDPRTHSLISLRVFKNESENKGEIFDLQFNIDGKLQVRRKLSSASEAFRAETILIDLSLLTP